MANWASALPTVTSCTFLKNSAEDNITGTGGAGGGMYNYLGSSSMVINCIFSGNSAGWWGGGIANEYAAASLTIVNCTLSGNIAGSGGGITAGSDSSTTVTNSILWGNTPDEIGSDGNSTTVVTHSDIKLPSGTYTGIGNINIDPLFVDADGPDDVSGNADDDLHLRGNSPCIDAGTSEDAPDQDIEGNSRPQGTGFDMGVYEYVPTDSDRDKENRTAQIESFITRLYRLCLNRNPDQPGLDGWVSVLLNGIQTGSDVANGFVFSPEFISQNKTNEEYLQILYEALFNRKPDTAGLHGWLDALDSGSSREVVLNEFIKAAEFAHLCDDYDILAFPKTPKEHIEAFVTRFYQACLDRDPNPEGIKGWTDNLLNHVQTGADVAHGVIDSIEFLEKDTTGEEYLTILYKAFFDRDPDEPGFQIWLAELKSNKDRGDVLDGFLYSKEFAELCQTYGINPY